MKNNFWNNILALKWLCFHQKRIYVKDAKVGHTLHMVL